MNSQQVAELVVTLREVRQALRELHLELRRSKGRIRRLEIGFAVGLGALVTYLGPGLLRLVG